MNDRKQENIQGMGLGTHVAAAAPATPVAAAKPATPEAAAKPAATPEAAAAPSHAISVAPFAAPSHQRSAS